MFSVGPVQKVDYVPDIAVGIAESQELKDAITEGNDLTEKLKKAKDLRENDLKRLFKDEESIMQTIDAKKTEFIQKINNIVEHAKEEVRNNHSKFRAEVSEELKRIGECVTSVETKTKILENQTNERGQLFVDLKLEKESIEKGNVLINSIGIAPVVRQIGFVVNEELNSILSTDVILGSVKYLHLYCKLSEATHSAKKLLDDSTSFEISDIKESIGDTLLITDYTNQRLGRIQLFSAGIDWLDLDGHPMSVCHLNKTEVAVSLRNKSKIQFVTTGSQMKLTSWFNTEHQCNRICYRSNKDDLYVCCGGVLFGETPGKIKVYSKDGKMKRSFGESLFSTPVDIKIDMTRQSIYVADRENGIFELDLAEKVLRTLKNKDLIGCWSVCAGTAGVFYACFYDSNKLVELDSTGEVLSEVTQLNRPFCLYLDQKKGQLFVGHTGNGLVVLSLSKYM